MHNHYQARVKMGTKQQVKNGPVPGKCKTLKTRRRGSRLLVNQQPAAEQGPTRGAGYQCVQFSTRPSASQANGPIAKWRWFRGRQRPCDIAIRFQADVVGVGIARAKSVRAKLCLILHVVVECHRRWQVRQRVGKYIHLLGSDQKGSKKDQIVRRPRNIDIQLRQK